ncbi:MAG: CHAP domain-containing protein, partial [Myxococcaceae bacterium]|nr:CHAP domain-containing protein [Myxococcaceae bacterium]
PAAAVNFCGGTSHVNACGRPVNIYPCCPNGSNCTWWAWESACRNWGIGFVNWGNANTWAAHARNDPRVVLVGPQPGSIATSTLGNYGHVAWTIGVGSGVTVTEQNCCTGCNPGTRTFTHGFGKFQSGFVVRRGTQCGCSAGQSQRESCGNCGSRVRHCDGCSWGGWSSCAGADPNGGNEVCDIGAKGVCEAARLRCVAGNVECRSVTTASAEVCDGLDNDCNDQVDDGHPPIGAVRPAFAATLVDASWPTSMKLGERGTIWAKFRNDGTQAWTRDNLWLSAYEDTRLSAPTWPAYDVAATIDAPVQPGEVAHFSFDVVAQFDTDGELDETFMLKRADGPVVACPQGEVRAKIRVLHTELDPNSQVPGDGNGGGSGEALVDPNDPQPTTQIDFRGCSAAPGLVPLALLLLLARRRNGNRHELGR